VVSLRGVGEGAEVVTGRGTYAAGAVVVAAGAWTPGLVRGLPLTIERQVQLWFRPAEPRATLGADRLPVFLWDTGDGRLFYGLPDLGDGVKTARHHGGEPQASPSDVRRAVDGADIDEVRAFLRRHLPDADAPPVAANVCLYTNTPSHHFLIDRHSEHRRVWVVSACSGHGFKFVPAIGEAVARWIGTDQRPELLAGFSLERAASTHRDDPLVDHR
jgi:sarcosine oxidase